MQSRQYEGSLDAEGFTNPRGFERKSYWHIGQKYTMSGLEWLSMTKYNNKGSVTLESENKKL